MKYSILIFTMTLFVAFSCSSTSYFLSYSHFEAPLDFPTPDSIDNTTIYECVKDEFYISTPYTSQSNGVYGSFQKNKIQKRGPYKVLKDGDMLYIKHPDSSDYKLIYQLSKTPLISTRLGFIQYKTTYVKDTVIEILNDNIKTHFFKLDTIQSNQYSNPPFIKLVEAIDSKYFIPKYRFVHSIYQDTLEYKITTITKKIKKKDLPIWYLD